MKRHPELRRTRPYQTCNRLHNPLGSLDSPHTVCYASAWEAFSHLAPSYHLGDSLPDWGPWPDSPRGKRSHLGHKEVTCYP